MKDKIDINEIMEHSIWLCLEQNMQEKSCFLTVEV